jgi:hypothetical protein
MELCRFIKLVILALKYYIHDSFCHGGEMLDDLALHGAWQVQFCIYSMQRWKYLLANFACGKINVVL